jgi:GMP synthase (glutamine-hydrolysing)
MLDGSRNLWVALYAPPSAGAVTTSTLNRFGASSVSVLIIKHVYIEGPGLIEYSLRQEKISSQVLTLKSGIHLPSVDGFTHIVILGGPMNVYEDERYPFLREEDRFIKEAIRRGRSILGICLGAQLIAKALGAKILKTPEKEIGWYDISLTRTGSQDPLFSKLPKTFPVFQWHEDTFETPKAGKLLATSTSVPGQAFRCGENVYGLQFHLEVTEEMIQDWMKSYEEEFEGSGSPLISKLKILTDTEINIETYTRRGMSFLSDFFRQPVRVRYKGVGDPRGARRLPPKPVSRRIPGSSDLD